MRELLVHQFITGKGVATRTPPTQETKGTTGLPPQGTLGKVLPPSPLVKRCPARRPCVSPNPPPDNTFKTSFTPPPSGCPLC